MSDEKCVWSSFDAQSLGESLPLVDLPFAEVTIARITFITDW